MGRSSLLRNSIQSLLNLSNNGVSFQEFTTKLAEESRRLTGASTCILCTKPDDCDALDYAAASGDLAQFLVGLRVNLDSSPLSAVYRSGEPRLFEGERLRLTGGLFDSEHEPLQFDDRAQNSISSGVVVPLRSGNTVIGVLAALNRPGDTSRKAFGQDDLEMLQLMADLYETGFQKNTATRNLFARNRELQVLYGSMATSEALINVQAVLDRVVKATAVNIDSCSVSLFLMNDERTHLYIASAAGLTDVQCETMLSADSKIVESLLISGDVLSTSELDSYPEVEDFSGISAGSLMAVPVQGRNEPLGMLVVCSQQRNLYQDDDLKTLQAAGVHAGIAIENALLYEDARRQAEETSALYSLSNLLGSSLNTVRNLNSTVLRVRDLFRCDGVCAFVLADQDPHLYCAAQVGMNTPFDPGEKVTADHGLIGWVYEWQTPQAVADVVADARNSSFPLNHRGAVSALLVPLQMGEVTLGVLGVTSRQRRHFTVAEMELLYTIANQAGAAIYNARLYRLVRQRSNEMRRYFRRVTTALGDAMKTAASAEQLVALTLEMVRASTCALYVQNEDVLHLASCVGFRASAQPDREIPVGAGLTGWVARRGQSLTLADVMSDPRSGAHIWMLREQPASYIAVPIRAARQTLGVLELTTCDYREFERDDARLLTLYARRLRFSETLQYESV